VKVVSIAKLPCPLREVRKVAKTWCAEHLDGSRYFPEQKNRAHVAKLERAEVERMENRETTFPTDNLKNREVSPLEALIEEYGAANVLGISKTEFDSIERVTLEFGKDEVRVKTQLKKQR